MPEPVLDIFQLIEYDGILDRHHHKTMLALAKSAVYWVLYGHFNGEKISHGTLTKLSVDLVVDRKTLLAIWQNGQNATEVL
jgi:hypothetical protein